jgi:5-hydroxyisourate hydrolase-like protein (transthyretin family)
MIFMLQSWFSRHSARLACAGLVMATLALHAQDNERRGRKYKAPPPSSTIEVTVLKADSGKPIENAAVIFHPVEGDKDKGSMELKTNEDGKAKIDVIPVGDTVRLQVIANGYQTYGQDYKIDKAEMSMEVRMNRPGHQYSIYKNDNSASNNSGNSSGSGSNSSNSGKSDSGQGNSNSSGQQQSQPQNQPQNQSQNPPQKQ